MLFLIHVFSIAFQNKHGHETERFLTRLKVKAFGCVFFTAEMVHSCERVLSAEKGRKPSLLRAAPPR
jgi:hypothetical protein